MIKIAILGLGKVGRTLLSTIQDNPDFKNRFSVSALWNRSKRVFESIEIPPKAKVYDSIEELLHKLGEIDLVVECAHPDVLIQYAEKILHHTDLFISSPTALAKADFRDSLIQKIEQSKHNCYIPLGASIGVWDIIRLDETQQLKSLKVYMKKHPSSFKINDNATQKRLAEAQLASQPIEIARGPIAQINAIAPQNTNTMAIYALAASELGFLNCEGTLIADTTLEAHIIELEAMTKGGLKLLLIRNNPAGHGAVTGSATFGSFLNSLYHYSTGILHGPFTFC